MELITPSNILWSVNKKGKLVSDVLDNFSEQRFYLCCCITLDIFIYLSIDIKYVICSVPFIFQKSLFILKAKNNQLCSIQLFIMKSVCSKSILVCMIELKHGNKI